MLQIVFIDLQICSQNHLSKTRQKASFNYKHVKYCFLSSVDNYFTYTCHSHRINETQPLEMKNWNPNVHTTFSKFCMINFLFFTLNINSTCLMNYYAQHSPAFQPYEREYKRKIIKLYHWGHSDKNTSVSMLLRPLPKQRSDYSGLIPIFIHVIVTFLCTRTMYIQPHKQTH